MKNHMKICRIPKTALYLRHELTPNLIMNYNSNPIHTLYDNETLKHLIEVIVEKNDTPAGTTFLNLCNQIRQQAIRDRALADLANTVYSCEELAPEEQVRISRLLWELIWEHKVFLLFGRSPLLGLNNGEDRFVKY